MDQNNVLRELTNLPLLNRTINPKQSLDSGSTSSGDESIRRPLHELIAISNREVDFGVCLPGSIHQKKFTITLLQELSQASELQLCLVCQQQYMSQMSSLVFGVKRLGQMEYYDDYRMKLKNKKQYEFRIGVKTPMLADCHIQSTLYVHFMDYAPLIVILKQKAQIPELTCIRELYFENERMVKLSYVHGRNKRECKVPFRLNNQITIAVVADLIGLEEQKVPLLDVKPRSMTLSGKGQFSLVFTMNLDEETQYYFAIGVPRVIRRILTLKIKETNFHFHFPVQVTYYPEPKKGEGNAIQQN